MLLQCLIPLVDWREILFLIQHPISITWWWFIQITCCQDCPDVYLKLQLKISSQNFVTSRITLLKAQNWKSNKENFYVECCNIILMSDAGCSCESLKFNAIKSFQQHAEVISNCPLMIWTPPPVAKQRKIWIISRGHYRIQPKGGRKFP